MHIEQLWRSMRNVGYLICGVVLVSGLLRAAVGEAATYYVAKTGSDNNSCAQGQSQSTPKLTIQSGLTCLQAGDTLYVKGGTYNEEFINPPGGTSWKSPVTIAAFPGDRVTLKPEAGSVRVFTFAAVSSSYIIVDGFILDASNVLGDAIKITNSTGRGQAHHIRIQNSEIFGAGISSGGGWVQGILADGTGNEFINLDIHHNGFNHYTHAMYISGSHILVKGCKIHDNPGFGIHVFNSSDYTSAHDNVVIWNRVYNNNNAQDSPHQSAVLLSSGANNVAYSNIIYNNHTAISVDYRSVNAGVYNNIIYNNHKPNGDGHCIYNGNDTSGTVIQNNLCWQNDVNSITDFGSKSNINQRLSSDPSFMNEILSGIVSTQRMLSYNKLKDRPRDFFAATGLTLAEFEKLLPAFQGSYDKRYPNSPTRVGKPQQRRAGGEDKGVLHSIEDKLLFILVYQKANPPQMVHALQSDLSQPQVD